MATTGTPRRPVRPSAPAAPPARRSGNGARRPPRRPTVWQKIRRFFTYVTFFVSLAILTAVIAIGVQLSRVPRTIDIPFNPPGRSLIYSSDGVLLAKLFSENRQVVPLERIPKNLQNATVAFEDRRFWTHQGVDFQGMARALTRTVKSRGAYKEGASTITQQLARNVGIEGLTTERTVQRKWHELIVANQIEKSYTKQRILEMYLNQINYGSGAYGVQAAAQTYFGKDVKDLNLAQCALLAGLPNRPTYFNPYKDKTAAQEQRNRVLDNMLQEHMITPQQCASAKKAFIHLAAPKPPRQGSQILHAPYFVNYVVDQISQKYGAGYLLRGNLRVSTTLNYRMQQIAEDELRRGIRNAGGYGPNQGCLVALDPKTGEVKAMVGGVDYNKDRFNIVTQGPRQPGSLFKVVVYGAAIDSGLVKETTRVRDAPVTYHSGGKPYTPKDDEGYSYRNVDLRTALARSINVPAVKVMDALGPPNAIRYARAMGVKSQLDPYLSLALGASAVTPLEIAGVYGTVAAGGSYAAPSGVTRLSDRDGKVIEDLLPQVLPEVLSRETVVQLDDMLQAVVEPGGTGAGAGDVPNARGKTGTTQGHKDVWFVGYTPELVCAVWAGHPYKDPKTGADQYGMEMRGNAWGATVCVPIWRDFMLRAVPLYKAARAKNAPKAKPTLVSAKDILKNMFADSENPSALAQNGGFRDDAGVSRRARRRAETSPAPLPDAPPDAAVDAQTPLAQNDTLPNTPPPNTPPPNTSLPRPIAVASPPPPPAVVIPPTPRVSLPSVPDAPRRMAAAPPRPRRAAPPATVTVRINPEDGLLANAWTPYSIEKTYDRGKQPRRYTRMYKPPPGER